MNHFGWLLDAGSGHAYSSHGFIQLETSTESIGRTCVLVEYNVQTAFKIARFSCTQQLNQRRAHVGQFDRHAHKGAVNIAGISSGVYAGAMSRQNVNRNNWTVNWMWGGKPGKCSSNADSCTVRSFVHLDSCSLAVHEDFMYTLHIYSQTASYRPYSPCGDPVNLLVIFIGITYW